MQNLYIEALESIEKLANCKPGRCDLPTAERAKLRDELTGKVLSFVRAKTRSKEWGAKQDAVLAELGNHV